MSKKIKSQEVVENINEVNATTQEVAATNVQEPVAEKTLSEKMSDADVTTFTVTEMAIIAAIRQGNNTLASIEEVTSIKQNVISSIIESLTASNVIMEVPGEECSTFVIKVSPNRESKKLKLAGQLILPVSSFVDSDGQRYVTRGTWHKIDADVDILNDIEWTNVEQKDSELQSVMKNVTEKKRKRNEERVKNDVAADGPATEEDAALVGKWHAISDRVKMNIHKIGATKAEVSFSPRMYNELNPAQEFPYGTNANHCVATIEEVKQLLSGALSVTEDQFSSEKMFASFVKICAFKSTTVDEAGNFIINFSDALLNRGGKEATITSKVATISTTGEISLVNGIKNVIPVDDVRKTIEAEFPLFMSLFKQK